MSENWRFKWEFFALTAITSKSDPAETPVICQVAVTVPLGKFPTLNVGVVTEKRPNCDFRVTEAPERTVFEGVLTWFRRTTVTVLVSPTLIVEGN